VVVSSDTHLEGEDQAADRDGAHAERRTAWEKRTVERLRAELQVLQVQGNVAVLRKWSQAEDARRQLRGTGHGARGTGHGARGTGHGARGMNDGPGQPPAAAPPAPVSAVRCATS
jgi:hypothetical protein